MVMTPDDQLRQLVATLLMVPAEEVGAETSLSSLHTSFDRVKLGLGLKRLGLSLTSESCPATFGGLQRALAGPSASVVIEKSNDAAQKVPAGPSANSGWRVGIDIQEMSSLPSAADYWEHEFYQGVFSKAELAYAVVQSEPRRHLAGFWCAKEALRKCDSSFAKTELNLISVLHEETGRPYLTYATPTGHVQLPHAVSISHANELATAVVIAGVSPGETQPDTGKVAIQPASTPRSTAPRDLSEPSRSSSSLLLRAVFLLALAAGVLLLIQRFWRA